MKFSAIKTEQPFTLTTNQGDIELKFTKFTIADGFRRNELCEGLYDGDTDKSQEELIKILSRTNIARLMCSVKRVDNGDYFFDGTVDDFLEEGYEFNLVNALIEQVDKLNPLVGNAEDETLEGKKNNSSVMEGNS